tara:strand:- start:22 stop:411 length:390 start_codon:yes stop_codon:yes gene_type:complete
MECTAIINSTASATLTFTSRHCDNVSRVDVQSGSHKQMFTISDTPVDQIRIYVQDKTEGYVEITNLEVDGIDLQQCILQGKFWPDYNANYYAEQTPPKYYKPGTQWYHNGEWCLDITKPIWEYMLTNNA